VYGAFLLAAYLTIVVGVGLGLLPVPALFGLATLGLAVPAFLGARRYAGHVGKLIPAMGMNVVINILTPVLVAVGLFVA
jgi:1,4-dihydroxy-2-naphthoate octaprenyltransferase